MKNTQHGNSCTMKHALLMWIKKKRFLQSNHLQLVPSSLSNILLTAKNNRNLFYFSCKFFFFFSFLFANSCRKCIVTIALPHYYFK